ncbi:MAG: hypothetical protein HY698_15860, partial [Deltaproteobacteria bacterium]|nr:hypothetical protein [Deltaproteobacteria bacterium]
MRESTIDDISEWYGLKQSLSRDGFVQRFTYPFLVQKPKAPGEKTGDDFGERIGYSTNIVDVNAIVSSHVPARLSGTRVIAVEKAPGNPFP